MVAYIGTYESTQTHLKSISCRQSRCRQGHETNSSRWEDSEGECQHDNDEILRIWDHDNDVEEDDDVVADEDCGGGGDVDDDVTNDPKFPI
jgi:hypothetical protein